MPNREDVLRDETFNDVEEIEKRVFYTLEKNKSLQAHRNSKAIALIVSLLHRNGTLTDEQVDDFLLEVIH